MSLSQEVVLKISEADWASTVLLIGLGLVAVLALASVAPMVLVYAERKLAAHFQCRLGPMRVGWHGTLQTIADTLKLLLKEDIVPLAADRMLYTIAPILAVGAAMLALIAIPFTQVAKIADMNIGVLYVSAVSGFGVIGILIGGWGSNNKWSLLGAMRAGAQIISYELSMTLALLVIVIFSGSMKFSDIVQAQAEGWWIWRAHFVGVLAFILFLISSTAEINRTPFDLAEGESELTAGFHTEYSGMRFAFFFLAEYVNLLLVSAIGATLFLGGWMPFHIGQWQGFNNLMDLLPQSLWFVLKVCFLVFMSMWFRWTFPRLRVDQLMRLEWKVLLPLGLINLLLAAVCTLTHFYFY